MQTLSEYSVSTNTPKPGNPELRVRRTLKGHFGKVHAVAWAQDSQSLVSAAQDGKMILWNAFTGMKALAISLKSCWVMTADYSGSGNFVCSGGLDNTCSIYPINRQNPVLPVSSDPIELVGHEGYISCCRFLDDSTVLSTSGDATAMLWDVEKEKSVHKFSEHKADVMTACFLDVSEGGNLVVTGSCDASVKVWDRRTKGKESLFTMNIHESDINSVAALGGSGFSFVTGSDDSKSAMFDIRAPESPLAVYHHDRILSGVTSVDSSKSGKYVLVSYDEGVVRVWDTLYGSILQELQLDGSRVSSLRVSPDGRAVAAGSWDSMLRVWA